MLNQSDLAFSSYAPLDLTAGEGLHLVLEVPRQHTAQHDRVRPQDEP